MKLTSGYSVPNRKKAKNRHGRMKIRSGGKDNPSGSKMYKRSLSTSRRGCDGTLRS